MDDSRLPPDAVPCPADFKGQPRWFRMLSRLVLRLGMARSNSLLTLVVCLLAVLAGQAVITFLGEGDRVIAMVSALVCSLLLAPVIGAFMLRLVFQLEEARQQLSVLATRDDLTGVNNRRHFMVLAQREWERARRYNTAAALLLVDVDHFKLVNDSHGHLCGDELLRRIAAATAQSLRQADVLARFGGEELILFLPQTDPLGALDVAERIRERVQALVLQWRGNSVGTTVSIGVAPLRPELPSLEWMIHEADTALYAAKSDGRNRVRALPFERRRGGAAFPVDR